MKSLLTPSKVALAIAVLGWSATAFPQSLGAIRAKAWIGRPLEMIVPVRIDPQQARDDCVHADVFYGDTRVADRFVTARYQEVGGIPRVQVLVDRPVDEPSVSVAVRAGCGNVFTRRYTVLADLPPEEMTVPGATQYASRPATSMLAAAALPVPVAAAPLVAERSLGSATTPRRSVASANATPKPAGARGPRSVVRRAPRATMVAPVPAELPAAAPVNYTAADFAPALRLTPLMTTEPGDAASRATAAMLWRAINADPEEIQRTTAMLQGLEAEVAQMRNQVARSGAALTDAKRTGTPVAPVATNAERPAEAGGSWLQSALLALAALVLGAGALAWWRRRRAASAEAAALESQVPSESWGENETVGATQPPRTAPQALAAASALPVAEPLPVHAQPAAPAVPTAPPTVTLPDVVLPVLADAVPPAVTAKQRQAKAAAVPHALRMEALTSTLQEAQFLASVGLRKEAQHVLRTYIRDSERPAPVAFYEVMVLSAHSEDNRKALPGVRRRFHEVYGVPAPSLDDLEAPAGAEAHAPLMEKIAAAWPSLRVLDIIERRVFARPNGEESLSIHAWRDLLWLHDMAREVLQTMGIAGPAPVGDESLAPWANSNLEYGEDGDVPSAHDDVSDPSRFALDLDVAAAPSGAEVSEGVPALARSHRDAVDAAMRQQEPALALQPLEDDDAFQAAMSGERASR